MKKIIFLAMLSTTFMTGCHTYGGGIIIDNGYAGHPAPPPHAPAYGHRMHRYYYYPNAEIYFDIGSNMYFYLDTAGAWQFSVTLPIHLRHHLQNAYVEVEMDNDRPYLKHKYYKNKYKSHPRYIRKYDNSRPYRNDGILRHGPAPAPAPQQYRNDHKYDQRQLRNEQQYERRENRNERQYERREKRNERQYERRQEIKENRMQQKQDKSENYDDDKKRDRNNRRNDLQ